MSKDQIIIIAAAGAGLYMLSKMLRPAQAASAPRTGTAASLNNGGNVPVTEIMSPGAQIPGSPGYGWRYYSDGTAISPSGDYYLNGSLVYSGASAGMMSMAGG